MGRTVEVRFVRRVAGSTSGHCWGDGVIQECAPEIYRWPSSAPTWHVGTIHEGWDGRLSCELSSFRGRAVHERPMTLTGVRGAFVLGSVTTDGLD